MKKIDYKIVLIIASTLVALFAIFILADVLKNEQRLNKEALIEIEKLKNSVADRDQEIAVLYGDFETELSRKSKENDSLQSVNREIVAENSSIKSNNELLSNTLQQTILQVSPSYIAERTVSLHCFSDVSDFSDGEIMDIYESGQNNYEARLGSGVIVDAGGGILTSKHVVEDTPLCSVSMTSGPNHSVAEKRYYARVIKTDEKLDYAKLEIRSDTNRNLVTKDFKYFIRSNSEEQLGDKIFVAGFSDASNYMFSITEGIVSGFSDQDEKTNGVYLITDASIDSGNSGGATVNTFGQLIGLPTLVKGSKQVLGYVLDLSRAEDFIGGSL